MAADLSLNAPTRVGVILVVALLITAFVARGISRLMKRLPAAMVRGRGDQRTRTLTTVLRSTLIAAIWIVAVITLLSEAGVNLGAFVATATVIGGAVAFGAQTLVRDVIAGFFVLAEDQYGVGDVVDLGHATGTVERISLRSTRLRDNEGRVWWVPNGQIIRVANLTQGFANAVVDAPFPITAEVAATIETLTEVVAPLGAEVLGVQELADDRFILRVTARTEPGQQFASRRSIRAAIADAYRDGRLPKPTPGGTTVVVLAQPESSEAD